MHEISPLKKIVILSDRIAGHVNQSRGVAHWLSLGTGADVAELEIPKLGGVSRAMSKLGIRSLLSGSRRKARDWLSASGGDALSGAFSALLVPDTTHCVAIISAGSACAPYNLALGLLFGAKCIALMTPSIIGIKPFDYAIVPQHDSPPRAKSVLATLGAPNMVLPAQLEAASAELLAEHPSGELPQRWGILIGGDDNNYKISARWIRREIGMLIRMSEDSGAALYITTSRRTSPEAESALEKLAARLPSVKLLLLASKSQQNPVYGILGACSRIFVTDDSISLTSEAATAGHRVILMRTERVRGLRQNLSTAAHRASKMKLYSQAKLFGPAKFDTFFDALRQDGRLVDWEEVKAQGFVGSERADKNFNEARRAAEWLYSEAFAPILSF